ncbi:hypothetical protein VTO73DRAFT_9980 [Trametes versicolor]
MNSSEPHTPGLMKPHICCYTHGNLDTLYNAPTSSRAELGYAELFIEVKPDIALDLFVDPPPDATSKERGTHDFFARFRDDNLKRRAERAFGQHITYALEIQARQHRVHLFSISIAGSYARLLRWDRSGIIVTESFDLLVRPDLLSEFLARFAFASEHERGHDGSMEAASPQEELLFRDVVTKYVQDQLDLADDDLTRAVAEHYQEGCVYAMRVSTKDPATPAVERYLVSRPVTSPLQLVGRATRGHWAVHADTERLVFLKDIWRRRGEQEGTVIADLNAAGVRNVPQFVAQGDVYQHPSVLDKTPPVQRTETDRYDTQPWVCPIRGAHVSVSTHIHYRLVVGTVGYPLRRLKGTDELLYAAYDVFQAMRDTSSKAQRIHRDISIGNIVLVKEPGCGTRKGYLIDWETSSAVDSEGHSLDSTRTGTWKFMSSKVLSKPELPHTLEDDMESLLYVVLYCALLYLPHNLDDESLETVIQRLFDHSVQIKGVLRGGSGKVANRAARTLTERIKFANPDLQKWLDDAMDLHGRVGVPSVQSSLIWREPENLDKLWRDFFATHQALASGDRIENALPDPPTFRNKPESSLVTFVPPPRPTPPSKKTGGYAAPNGRVGGAHGPKRRREDASGLETVRRSDRLRNRSPTAVAPPAKRAKL